MNKYFLTLALAIFPSVAGLTQIAPIHVQASTTYNLSYELYGGTNHVSNPVSYTDSQQNFTLLPATKTNLSFHGWYKSETFSEVDRVTSLPGRFPGVTKLYAKWAAKNHTFNFISNGVTVQQSPTRTNFDLGTSPTYVALGNAPGSYITVSRDLNGDGKGDFIDFDGGNRHIYTSHPNFGFTTSVVTNNLINFAWDARFFDINDDDREDLIVLASNGVLTYSLRQADGSLGTETAFTLQSGGVSFGETIAFDMADIDGDGDLDIAIATFGFVFYRLNLGGFTFGPAMYIAELSNYGRGVRLIDLNQDGHLDVLGTSENSSFVKWGNGVTPFGGSRVATFLYAYRPFISDINQDGKYEYIGVSTGNSNPFSVSFNENLTANNPAILPGAGRVGFVSFVGNEMDANGDGYNDLFYLQSRGNSGMVYSRGDGNYTSKEFTSLQDDVNSGSLVFDPAFGTLGMMGAKWNDSTMRYYSMATSQSASHLSATTPPARNGYTFGGWFVDSAFNGNPFDFSATINADVTLHAKWILNSFSIFYDLNGGTNNPNNPTSLNVETNQITLQNPTKTGSLFLGWYDNSDFTGSPVTTIPANSTQSYSFYAKWLDPVSITFNSNGGSIVPQISTLPGETVTQPMNPTRPGYTFLGWFTNQTFTTPFTFTTMPNNPVTAFAKWQALTFTITFETNGGTTLSSISRNTDQVLSLPAAPTKAGHAFAGWFTNAALTDAFRLSKMPPNNVTLYAKWNVNMRQLQFILDETTTTQNLAYGTLVSSVLPTPTKYQFEFLGWSIDGETVINLSTYTMPDQNVVLTALFRDNVTPVVFTLNDGDTYAGEVDVIFNEGTATLNGQPVTSGYRITTPGTYVFIVTDGVNTRTVNFTVIEAIDNTNTRWIVFASILLSTWTILLLLYLFTKEKSSGGSSGRLVTEVTRQKPAPIQQTKPTTPKKVEAVKPVQPSKPVPQTITEPKPVKIVTPKEIKPSVKTEPIREVKPEPKKVKVDPLPLPPLLNPVEVEKVLVETVIFKKPLKVTEDPVEKYSPELKEEFSEVFVSDKRKVVIPELTYIPKTTNAQFYTNLFRYVYRFAGQLSESLLASLTQSVIKLTDEPEAQLKIIEASTRTADKLSKKTDQDYLLKILRRNVALNRDVLNPRNKYVYSYQRLATLLEEKGIYLEAVILVREAFERGLVDTPEGTFEKRLDRLEKKLIQTDGKRQDMLRK
jgi:uncharacterized repeat protein (TIGR02543 family)